MKTTLVIILSAVVATSDNIYCFKFSDGVAKGLIYGASTCYELILKNTDQFTLLWNSPERKGLVANNKTDFGITCADLNDYLNGGTCWFGPETNVNCGIMYGRLAYWNSVLPSNNVTKSIFDYNDAIDKAKRMVGTQKRSICKPISTGLECNYAEKGVIQW
jgi:hypothetical protein